MANPMANGDEICTCEQCGRRFRAENGFNSYGKKWGESPLVSTGISAYHAVYCSKGCWSAAKGGGGSSGGGAGGGGGIVGGMLANHAASKQLKAAKEQRKAEEEAREAAEAAEAAAETKRKNAAIKEALNKIRNFEFSEDDEGFTKDARKITAEYAECSLAYFSDQQYKKAYKDRIEKELKILNGTNQKHYDELLSYWNEEQDAIKQKQMKKLKMCGVISIVAGIFGLIGGVVQEGLGNGISYLFAFAFLAAAFSLFLTGLIKDLKNSKESNV